MHLQNQGYHPEKLQEFKEKMSKCNQNYLISESEDNSDEYVNFFFIGMYEGREVIYDAVIYTLRLHHTSEVYEIAEHKAAKRFPNYKKITYEEDENGDLKALDSISEEIGLFMAEVIMDLEEEESVKVQEHVEIDPNLDFGIGLDAALNVEVIKPEIISKFVKDYNEANLKLDKTLYAFQSQEEYD